MSSIADPSRTRKRATDWRAFAPLAVLILICIAITTQSSNFMSIANFIRIGTAASIPMILACGMTFIILMGSIDLSTEGTVAVTATMLSLLVANVANIAPQFDLGLWAVPLAIAAGALIGLLNGAIHVKLRIPSLIASLGIGFAGIGLATLILGGITVRISDNTIRGMALYRVANIPVAILVAIAAVLVALFVQNYTRLGRWAYVLGGGEDIAKLSGVPIERVRMGLFTLAGAFYGLGGALAVAQYGQGQALIAQGYLFTVITSVVVGGTALTGGVGGILNSVVGVLLVMVLQNGMVLVGVPSYGQQGVQGLLIITAVALSLDRTRAKIVK
jgi:ribose transport system permease protein